jgi:hypothetical protein
MTETNGNGSMRLFELDGSSLYLHSGNTIKERIAKEVVLKFNPAADLGRMVYAAFWIMEGSLGTHDLDPDKYPVLNRYLAERETLSFSERWELYISCEYEADELDILRLAYDNTRGHPLEVMEGMSTEEKKTE